MNLWNLNRALGVLEDNSRSGSISKEYKSRVINAVSARVAVAEIDNNQDRGFAVLWAQSPWYQGRFNSSYKVIDTDKNGLYSRAEVLNYLENQNLI